MLRIIIYTLFLLLPLGSNAQTINMSERVTMHYEDELLQEVLTDISESYSIDFAYSEDIIPIEKRVNLHIENEPMAVALDNLFVETYIVYARIGDQIVLKLDENKSPNQIGDNPNDARLTSKGQEIEFSPPSEIYQAEEMKSDSPIQTAKLERQIRLEEALGEALPKAITPGEMPAFKIDYSELDFGGALRVDLSKLKLDLDFLEDIDFEGITEATDSLVSTKVSIINPVKIKMGKKKDTSNISINLISGRSQNVSGIEIGGLLNTVDQDMEGLQIAGLGNTVEGNTVGTQVAGIYNSTKGETIGTQVAGIINIAEDFVGLQAAGIVNIANGDFNGWQIATISNIARNSNGGVQTAFISNRSGKIMDLQASLFNNKARVVKKAQIGMVNNAGEVKGVQFGLINFAEKSNASIGLLNFVLRGYNRVEIAGGDAIHLNASLKLGTKGFYNIFYTGKRISENTWTLGYGIGSYINIGKRVGINLEALAAHVSENADWDPTLNLLNRVRLTMDFRLGRRISFFLGPDLNYMFSKLYDADTNTYGSKIAPYTFIDKNTTSTRPLPLGGRGVDYNTKMWVGLNAGFRF